MTLTLKTEEEIRKNIGGINASPSFVTFLTDVEIAAKGANEFLGLPEGTTVIVNSAKIVGTGLEITFDSYGDGSSVFEDDSETSATVGFGSFEVEIRFK